MTDNDIGPQCDDLPEFQEDTQADDSLGTFPLPMK